MRGKKRAKKREILPDQKFNSILVAKFINKIMLRGQKQTATTITYKAFDQIAEKTKKPALEIFEDALKTARPLLEVKSKRIGGATYQVPMEVPEDRAITLAMRWIIAVARARQGKPMSDFLAEELLNVYNKTGATMTKRANMHKMAEANKAFAHFARF